MKLFNTNVICSLCNAPLTSWNAHTCTRCGRKICSRHSLLLRHASSYVLSSVCVGCSEHMAVLPGKRLSSQQQEREMRTQLQVPVGRSGS